MRGFFEVSARLSLAFAALSAQRERARRDDPAIGARGRDDRRIDSRPAAGWAGSNNHAPRARARATGHGQGAKEGERRAHLPRVDGQVGVVEAPVERLGRDGLVGRVVVRREVLVREGLRRVDALARVKDEHLLEQVERLRVGAAELLREGDALAFGERLDEAQGLWGRARQGWSGVALLGFMRSGPRCWS